MLSPMPRPPRDVAAGLFHVYTHVVWGYPALFRDDVDRIEFLRHLARVSSRDGFKCIVFCLMGNHWHLIVEVDDGVLPLAMHDLGLAYALSFNARAGLRGHVQYDRYNARRIVDEDDLVGRYAYVVNNPADAGLCEKAEDWLWSSHAGTIGVGPAHSFVDPTRVLDLFEWSPVGPREALRRYVDLRRKSYGSVRLP
ncbi:MAG: transposase [Ktedonobacterales bacterium]